jgi:hypothetical protein
MKASDAEGLRDPAALQELVRTGITGDTAGGAGHGSHAGELASVREALHAGHRIVIRTTYEITVDGEPIQTHLHVGEDGNLHSHALPNYQFHSAVEMVKKIVDLFPDEFTSSQGGQGHGGHSHEHP